MIQEIVLGVVILLFGIGFVYAQKHKKRRYFIQSYHFPKAVITRFKEQSPHLTDVQVQDVFERLKDYFYICHKANNRMVAMPSKVADDAWHAFLLFTKEYEAFSKKAFGRLFHHIPSISVDDSIKMQEALKTAWMLSCEKEDILYNAPDKLPRLFLLDKLLEIKDGNIYVINCHNKQADEICVKALFDPKRRSDKNSSGSSCGGRNVSCSSGCGGS
ncbi:MAG: hypothetical protein K0U47_01510 [Epsilonproteobacteria bacterium]|nr:hypothetical protein [Campylobacterota bacterium]